MSLVEKQKGYWKKKDFSEAGEKMSDALFGWNL